MEGALTMIFFFILIAMAFGADRLTANAAKKEEEKSGVSKKVDAPVIKYSAYEISKTLFEEKQGVKPQNLQEEQKRDEMKRFLKQSMGNNNIEEVDLDELKRKVEGEGLIKRIEYRRQVGNTLSGKRPVVEKNQKMIK